METHLTETVHLSDAALNLFRTCVDGDNPRVDEANLEAYRELAAAGLMYPVSTFKHGPESVFRFSDDGWNCRHEILARASGSPEAVS